MAVAAAIAMQTQQHPNFMEAAASEQQSDAKSQTSDRTPPTQAKGSDKRPKRVRTGCLTCRDRHLKCDEGTPACQNCLKSNRECKRGLRFNWIELQVKDIPDAVPRGADWAVSFEDNSREIASEYRGGIERYPQREERRFEPFEYPYDYHHRPSFPDISSDHSGPSAYGPAFQQQMHNSAAHVMTTRPTANPYMSAPDDSYTAPADGGRQLRQPDEPDFLQDQEEVLFMQVFIEEVGLWMDSMDAKKHFSRQLPFHALGEPMLKNAFLACGARHLALVNPRYSEDNALNYYDRATKHLLDALQDPDRDTVLCATTAVILNVYEIMCEKALQRMNHIAGARALIKECGWSARSTGIGAACFWLNVGMELLSCLHFNWQVAWDPDEWGVDMDLAPERESGREEFWTHRIVYIVAKVCNFRASIPRDPSIQEMNKQQRYQDWMRLKSMADTWNRCVPRTMHPLAYLFPGQTLSGSAFPEVYLVKRSSIVARLFYHTCMCLLAQINPLANANSGEMRQMLEEHAQLICGITAHVKDRGVASVALRSLAIAAETLKERRAQEEVLQIIDKIRQETGWRVGFLHKELQNHWGWNEQPVPQQQAPPQAPQPPPQPQLSMRPMFNNPLAGADFNNAQHPYQEVYVPANINLMQQAQPQPSAAHAQPPHNSYGYY